MPFKPCRDEILAQLERILASKDFCYAPSLSKLLRFVVEQALEGKAAGLKEVTIGVEVFGHGTDETSGKTPVVRVSASRLRKKLAAYYETEGREDPWIIALPSEGYLPQISARSASYPEANPPDPQPPVRSRGGSRWKTFARVCAALTLVTISLTAWTYSTQTPVVIAFRQLTNTGYMKEGPLLTDGARLYFNDVIGGNVAMSAPVAGGAATRLDIPSLQGPTLLDYRADGHRFLVNDRFETRKLWEWTPGTPPRLLNASDLGRWVPDSLLTQVPGWTLLQPTAKRSAPDKKLQMPGIAEFPRWLPSRQLVRFTVGDPPGEKYSLWEMRGQQGIPGPLPDYPKNARFGTWSPDGKLYVFQANRDTADGGDDIWAVNERGPGFLRKNAKPIRLTDGPLDFGYPVPSVDGSAIFSIGTVQRMEIVRYDAVSGRFQPFLGALRGIEPDFSRDHGWIVYSSHPERTLWKVKVDGTNASQLTFPPMIATQPHWSPDGSRIAFVGQLPGHSWRIYLISSNGGNPMEVTDFPVEQGVPTWSPNGSQLVFGERRLARPDRDMELHVVDLASKRVSSVPDSRGTWTARWSPDGRFILATSVDFHRLLLFDCRANTWRQLVSFHIIDDPSWGADSRDIYFYADGIVNTPDSVLDKPAIYRMNVHGNTPEMMVDLREFDRGAFPWHGVAPDGTPLAVRRRTMQEVYKLTIKW